MNRLALGVPAAGLLALLAIAFQLARLEADGVPHFDDVTAEGVPVTLYLPNFDPAAGEFLGDGHGLPAVVLSHGFASDRVHRAPLARAFATAGYVVLAIDLPGHGQNATPISPGALQPALGSAVEYLRHPRLSHYVDASYLFVAGVSLGANVSLDYATADPEIAGAILIAGGTPRPGRYRPRNVLLIYGENDLPWVAPAAERIAEQLANVERTEAGRTYGEPRSGNAVRRVVVPGMHHANVGSSPDAIRESIGWLDRIAGIERNGPIPSQTGELAALGAWGLLALLFALPGIGFGLAALAPQPDADRVLQPGWGLLLLGGALLATLPLFAAPRAGLLPSSSYADPIVSHVGAAGLVTLLGLALLRGPELRRGLSRAGRASLLGLAAAVLGSLLVSPLAPAFHGFRLGAHQLGPALGIAACWLAFSLAFNLICRARDWWWTLALALAGRALLVAVVAAGFGLGIFHFRSGAAVVVIAPIWLLLEGLRCAYYARARHPLPPALLEALWVGWFVALVAPLRA